MIKTDTEIEGAYIIEPDVFGDNRGWFYESYSEKKYREIGINTVFVQDNRSFSEKKGTLRGLHCQKTPFAQAKLVTCTRGEIIDVAVDIRKDSPSYLKHICVNLSESNKKQLFIPKGCLHGFITVSDNVELLYKADDYYSPENDRSIRYNDPVFGIEWGTDEPVLSEKDRNAPLFKESDVEF